MINVIVEVVKNSNIVTDVIPKFVHNKDRI